jgi:heat-inducible transcriptional repressor
LIERSVGDPQLDEASETLRRLTVERHLDSVVANVTGGLDQLPVELRDPIASVMRVIGEDLSTRESERLYLEGTSNIVDEHKFADLETVRQVIGALEHRRVVLETMADALRASDVSVRIGSENIFEEMQACSVVTAPYGAEGNVLGTLGVVGPTRMDYRKTIAAVYEVSANLGRVLVELGM